MNLQITLDFLRKLQDNNDRDWFKAHKKDFDKAKKELEKLIANLLEHFTHKISPAYSTITPKDCIFRIYRDVRFSKDKSPYKTYLGAVIHPEGRKTEKPLFYLHVSPNDASFLAVGVYEPNKEYLKKIREEIDYNAEELQAIFDKKEFKKYFTAFAELQNGVLKTAPRGYPKDHPHIELLRLKHFIIEKNITDKELTSENITEKLAQIALAGQPLNDWLSVVWEETEEVRTE